ncbi:MAG: S26 family signal peptidase, partial [Gemmatimonadales bacterium]
MSAIDELITELARLPGIGRKTAQRLTFHLLQHIYHFRDPRRGEIVVFHAPKAAEEVCTGGIFVKRIIGLPGEVWAERAGKTYIDGKRLPEPYILPTRRDRET